MKNKLLLFALFLSFTACEKQDGYMYKVTMFVPFQWQTPTEFYLYPVQNDKDAEKWYLDNFKGRGFEIDSMKIEYYCTQSEWESK